MFADRYLAQLEQKYPHWTRMGRSLTSGGGYQLWVNVEQKPVIVDYWPSADEYRVGIALIYAPDSLLRNQWMTMVELEVNKLELTARK